MRRAVALVLFAVLAAVCAAAIDANSGPPRHATAARAQLRDVVLPSGRGTGSEVRARAAQWGGATQASNGETVTIYFSDAYPQDAALARSWADFMTSLVHGPELSTVTILLAPLAEVQQYCGRQALACYSPNSRTVVAPGTDPDPETTARGVLIHEYGHHVASTRLNTPFGAGDYGTKRWSSYLNVCARTRSGQLYPGAEDADHYTLNPGEGFAEAYRVLNEQRLGLPQEELIVSDAFYPNARALARLTQDVTQPWTGNTTATLRVALTAKSRTRTLAFATPFDGTLVVTPRQGGRLRVSVRLQSKSGIAASRTFAGASAARITDMVCGERRFTVRVSLVGRVSNAARTTVALVVSRP